MKVLLSNIHDYVTPHFHTYLYSPPHHNFSTWHILHYNESQKIFFFQLHHARHTFNTPCVLECFQQLHPTSFCGFHVLITAIIFLFLHSATVSCSINQYNYLRVKSVLTSSRSHGEVHLLPSNLSPWHLDTIHAMLIGHSTTVFLCPTS